MGNKLLKLFGNKEMRILLLGLDSAGHKTIFSKLKGSQEALPIPTISFYAESITYNKVELIVWDVGGQIIFCPFWHEYFPGTHALIFVVDCSADDRIDEARINLHRMLNDKDLKKDVAILIFVNKNDNLPQKMSVDEVTEKLKLSAFEDRKLHIEECCANTGDGLHEGLTWLNANVIVTPNS